MAAASQAHHTVVSNHKEKTYDTLIALFHFVTKVKRRLLKDHLDGNDLNVCSLFKDKRQEIWLFEDVKQALRKSSVVRLKDLSLNTLNYILKFHCNDLFWNTCLNDGKVTFEEFLNTHRSEIYVLTKCTNADNSSSCVLATSVILSNKNFELLFNRSYSLFRFFTSGNISKFSAKRGIDLHSLNQDVHGVLLDFFCTLRRSVNCLTEDQRAICKNVVFKETINQEIWQSIEKHIAIIAEKYKRKESELLKVQALRNSYHGEKHCFENRKRMLEDALNDAVFVQDQGFCDRVRQELHSLSQDENLILIKQLCCKDICIPLPHGQYRNEMYMHAVLHSAEKDLECLTAAYCSQVDEVPFDIIRKEDIKSDNENIETHNYLKLIVLIKDVGRNVFIDVLKTRLPGAHYGNAFIGMKTRLRPLLDGAEYTKLYPDGSVYSGDLTDLDLSLLYIILRNLGTIPPHSKSWGNNPKPMDRSISANLDRIREAKNCYVSHWPDCSISYDIFKKAWEEIRQSIVELGGDQYNAVIDILLTTAINPLMERDLIDAVQSLKKYGKQKKKDAEKFKEDLNKVKEDVRMLKRENKLINQDEEKTTDLCPLHAKIRIDGTNGPTVQELEQRVTELESEHIIVTSIQNGSIIFAIAISPISYHNVGFFLQVLDGFVGRIFSRHDSNQERKKTIIVSMETTDRKALQSSPLNIRCTKVTQTTATLQWTAPANRTVKEYIIACVEHSREGFPTPIRTTTRNTTLQLDGLAPSTKYDVTIISQFEVRNCPPPLGFLTYETLPSPPMNIRCTDIKQTTATLQWTAPVRRFKIVDKYCVAWMKKYSSYEPVEIHHMITLDTTLQLSELTPNTEYLVSLTSAGETSSEITIFTKELTETLIAPQTSATLQWTAQETRLEIGKKYSVFCKDYDGSANPYRITTGHTTLQLDKLNSNTKYNVTISPPSPPILFSTEPYLPLPDCDDRQTSCTSCLIFCLILFLIPLATLVLSMSGKQTIGPFRQRPIKYNGYVEMRTSQLNIPYYIASHGPNIEMDLSNLEYEVENRVIILQEQCRAQTKESSLFPYIKDVFSSSLSCDESMNLEESSLFTYIKDVFSSSLSCDEIMNLGKACIALTFPRMLELHSTILRSYHIKVSLSH